MEYTDTLVVGAGPAGLAVAACLARADVPYLVVERDDAVGARWRHHYERLHLHTVKEHSALPHLPFPDDYPQYPSRQQVVDYLDAYADHFDIRPRFGVEVTAAEHDDTHWAVETSDGIVRAGHLVLATGYNNQPKRPTWPGMEDFTGEVLHSADYRNGERFAGKRALVVGAGNSGAEIAIDLWEWGADPDICIRSPLHVMPRDALLPAQTFGLAMAHVPNRIADAIGVAVSKLYYPDLEELGITRPDVGPVTQVVREGRVPLLDIGTIALIRQAKIDVVGGIERFEGGVVVFEDGTSRPYDAVVLATGYRAALDRFLSCADQVTDARGYPTRFGEAAQVPNLYFVGFRNPPTGQLHDIRLEAPRVARAIAEES